MAVHACSLSTPEDEFSASLSYRVTPSLKNFKKKKKIRKKKVRKKMMIVKA
jgi:hypothetical protein